MKIEKLSLHLKELTSKKITQNPLLTKTKSLVIAEIKKSDNPQK